MQASHAQDRAAASPFRTGQSEDGLFDNLTVLLGSSRISGQARDVDKAGEAIVTATQFDESGRRIAIGARPTSSDGNVEISFREGGIRVPKPQPILAGQRLHFSVDHVDLGQREQWLDVPRLSIEADAEADRVAGTAPAGARVYLMATDRDGAFQRQSVDTGEDGRFEADFGSRMDIARGSSGNALILQAGVAFQASWALPEPVIAVGATAVEMQARPGERSIVELLDAEGRWKAGGEAMDPGGELRIDLRDEHGQLVPILPGDRASIVLEWAGVVDEAFDIEVPKVLARLDTRVERISGWAAPGQTIVVTVERDPAEPEDPQVVQRAVDADESGRWSLDLAGEIDLGPDSLASLRFPDRPGVQMALRAAQVREVDAFEAALRGQGQAGAWVQLAQLVEGEEDPARIETGVIGPDGRFDLSLRDAEGHARALREGSPLRTRIAVPALERPEADVLASQHLDLPIEVYPDTVTQQVSGPAPPGSFARVTLSRRGSKEVQVGESGRFVLDVDAGASALDDALVTGTEMELRLWDPATDIERRFDFTSFRMNPQIDSAMVYVEGYPGMEAVIDLERDGAMRAYGRCRVRRTHCLAEMRDEAGEPLEIAIGDQVFGYPSPGETGEVQIIDMTAHVDRGGRDVVGEAPPYERVSIEFHNDQGDGLPLDTVAGVDEMGVYDYELSATEWGLLLPGLESSVYHGELGSHRTMARAVIEAIRLYLDDSVVRGHAEPGTAFEIRVERPMPAKEEPFDGPAPGPVPASGSGDGDALEAQTLVRIEGRARYDGRFEIPLAGPLKEAGTWLRVGDRIVLEHKRGSRGLVVPPLVGWTVDAAGGIAGVGAPFARIRALHHLRAASDEAAFAQVDVEADRDGVFYLPAPAVSPGAVSRVEVMAFAGDDDRVFREVNMQRSAPRVFLPRLMR